MIAYKGFSRNLTAVMGHGTYQFRLGKKEVTEKSKTAKCGFHCCENPFECLSYYRLGNGNRYFMVEVSGNIDEDGAERISCTELTLLQELTLKELAGHGMMYMVKHPLREKWQQSGYLISVQEGKAHAKEKNEIAIARGAAPVVSGAEGSILGLILEPEPGRITTAKLFVAGADAKADTRYTIREDRSLQEVQHEKESS